MTTTINASTSSGLVNTADTSGILQLQTASTAAVTVDASQNVGIGTSSPGAKFSLTSTGSTTADGVRLTFGSEARAHNIYSALPTGRDLTIAPYRALTINTGSGTAEGVLALNAYEYTTFGTGSSYTERMRIDSSGNVGIGVTPSAWGSGSTALQLGNGAIWKSGSRSVDWITNGYNNGTNYIYNTSNAATYYRQYDGQHLWYNAPSGTAGNAITFTQAMTLDTSGNLLVGTTSSNGKITAYETTGNYVAYLRNTQASSPYGLYVEYTGSTPNNTGNNFIRTNDATADRFVVRSNGGIANYSANNVNLSDRREKTNFALAKSYLNTVCSIPVQTFNYIDQNTQEDDGLTLGVVAQDVQAVAPELVMESNWGTDENPRMRLSIYQTDLQYALMKSIQELKAINDQQAETINALTARIVALEK